MRREDCTYPAILPTNPEPQEGDYWKVSRHPRWTNEGYPEGTCWWVCAPGVGGAAGIPNHFVEEHEDGTISVLPQPNNSNSILVSKNPTKQFHGYIRKGDWEKV